MSNGDREQLGGFLRARRAMIRPESLGLPEYGRRRRVPGLRREEVAQLAGVSVDYYVRLEQGRGGGTSPEVLDAVARVLQLDATERAHLHRLARPPRQDAAAPAPTELRAGVRLVLDMLAGPAFVLGRCMDVLAWNAPADALLGLSGIPADERNMARHAFLDPRARTFYPAWEEVAAETVAYLRLDAARHPADRHAAGFVEELSARSPEFRRLWEGHAVAEKTHGRKLLRHPSAGLLDLGYETLALPGDPALLLVVYTAEPGSREAERLAGLTAAAAVRTPEHDAARPAVLGGSRRDAGPSA